jgi:sugar phosphate isomerase/epimerase
MLFGAMNFPVKPIISEIKAIGDLGFDYVELCMDPPQSHYSDIFVQRKLILKALETYQMSLTCHLPTFLSLCDLTDSIKRASLDETLTSMDIAAKELGVKTFVLHPGRAAGLGLYVFDTIKDYLFQSLEVLCENADKLGVVLCLENMVQRSELLILPQAFIGIFRSFPNLRMTLDIGHAHIQTKEAPYKFIQQFPDKIHHVHISDNLGKTDDHFPIGAGTVDYPRVIQALKEIGYDSKMTLEVFTGNPKDLISTKDTLLRLLKA